MRIGDSINKMLKRTFISAFTMTLTLALSVGIVLQGALFGYLLTVPGFAATTSTKSTYQSYYQGIEYLKAGKYDLAVKAFKATEPGFIKEGKKNNLANLYHRYGEALAKSGQYAEAERIFRLEATNWKAVGYEQDAIAATRNADMLKMDIRLFAEVPAELVKGLYHGVKYEPKAGTYIGAYAEGDRNIFNPMKPDPFYTQSLPAITGKKHALYLLYLDYSRPITHYGTHYKQFEKDGVALQLGLEPLQGGIASIKDDEYLANMAKSIGALKIPVFLRFANEMNDPTSPWYNTDPKIYIEKYRIVANAIHKHAPNAVMVWAPGWFPPNNITKYYPGDEYVDWVGVSLYKQWREELDILGKGVDRFRIVDNFENIYKLYADKKPIMVSESGVSRTDVMRDKDMTPQARKELEAYLAYMPILYPKLKALVYFDTDVKSKGTKYIITTDLLDTYKKGVSNPQYLSSIGDSATMSYSEVVNAPKKVVELSNGSKRFAVYVKYIDRDTVAKVIFEFDGKKVGEASGVPYYLEDLTPLRGKSGKLTVKAMNSAGKVVLMEQFDIMFK